MSDAREDEQRSGRALGRPLAVLFTSFHQSPLPLALLLRMAGVGRVGAISVDYPGSLLDVRHHVDEDVHEVERAASLADAMGYPPMDGPLPDAAAPHRARGAAALRRALRRGAPGRLGTGPRDPTAVARGAVRTLVDDGWCVAVTGAPSERALTAEVAGAAQGDARVRDLGGDTDLVGLGHVLAGARALISGNTGPGHLAAELGVPVVSVFAPVVPAGHWQPYDVPVFVLGDQHVGWAGCRARTCPIPGQSCLDPVTPAAIGAAVGRLTSPATAPVPHAPDREVLVR